MAQDTTVLSRRTLLGGGAGIAALTLAPWPRTAAAAIALETLAPGLTLLTGAVGNMLVTETAAGLVLVDTGLADEAEALVEALAALSDQPVTAVINTHWHPEQVGANVRLGESGAVIHAHTKTRQRLAAGYYLRDQERYAAALPAAGVPTESFHDSHAMTVGGRPIECVHLIEAHTDGDAAIVLPDANLIAIGGVMAQERDPEFDWFGGGWLGGRLDAFDRLLTFSDAATRFVPAQGPLFGRAELEAEQQMLLELFERMVEHIRLGQTPRDMLEAGVLNGLGRRFNDPLRLLYDLNKGFWAHHNKLMHDIV